MENNISATASFSSPLTTSPVLENENEITQQTGANSLREDGNTLNQGNGALRRIGVSSFDNSNVQNANADRETANLSNLDLNSELSRTYVTPIQDPNSELSPTNGFDRITSELNSRFILSPTYLVSPITLSNVASPVNFPTTHNNRRNSNQYPTSSASNSRRASTNSRCECIWRDRDLGTTPPCYVCSSSDLPPPYREKKRLSFSMFRSSVAQNSPPADDAMQSRPSIVMQPNNSHPVYSDPDSSINALLRQLEFEASAYSSTQDSYIDSTPGSPPWMTNSSNNPNYNIRRGSGLVSGHSNENLLDDETENCIDNCCRKKL